MRPFPVTAPAAMLPTPTGCVWGCGGRLCDSPGQKTYPYSSADDFMASEGFPGRVTPDGQRVPVPAASHPASASRPGRSPAPRPAGAAAHRPASGRWPGTARRHLPPRGCEGRGAGRGHRGAAGSSHPPLNTPLPPGKRLFIDFAGRGRGPSPSPSPPPPPPIGLPDPRGRGGRPCGWPARGGVSEKGGGEARGREAVARVTGE